MDSCSRKRKKCELRASQSPLISWLDSFIQGINALIQEAASPIPFSFLRQGLVDNEWPLFTQPLHGQRSAFYAFSSNLGYILNLQNSLHISIQHQPTTEVWWRRQNPLKRGWSPPGFTRLYLHVQKKTENKKSFWGWGSGRRSQKNLL